MVRDQMARLYKYTQFLNVVLGIILAATVLRAIFAMQFSAVALFVSAAICLPGILLGVSSYYIKESLRNLCGQIAILLLVFMICLSVLCFECFFDIYSLQFIDVKSLSQSITTIIVSTLVLLLITVTRFECKFDR